MPTTKWLISLLFGFFLMGLPLQAETTEDPAATTANVKPDDARLSAEELQKLVAPVALYPDTVLIQVLVATTVPLDVILADRLLNDNADASPNDLEEMIKSKQFDLSVEVVAIAFPDLIRRMSVNIDWTELVGAAMLAQSDDVMAAVQVMRERAIETGALVNSTEMAVSTSSETGAVIVQPADPEVVYVPQYSPAVVYSDPVGDALVNGLIIYGTVALIDEIFDSNDDWNDYWGCRNCADWNGGAIIRNPNIDIDVDGDVIIGNDINIGNDLERNIDGSWKPAEARTVAARTDLARRRENGEVAAVRLDRPVTRSEELRRELGQGGDKSDLGQLDSRADLLTKRTAAADALKGPTANRDPGSTVRRKPAVLEGEQKPKIARTASANRTKAASKRGSEVVERSRIRRER